MKTIIIPVIIILIFVAHINAANLGFASQDAGQSGEFLSYGAGARALAMGGAFVGVADDASTMYWNPAGLGQIQRKEITALYAGLYENTSYGFIGYVNPINEKYGTIGCAVVDLESTGYQLRDTYNTNMGEGNESEMAGIISYGKLLPIGYTDKPVYAGGSIKIVRQVIDSNSATSIGLDAGVLCKLFKNLSIGLDIQNLVAPQLKLMEATDAYPLSITVGAGYRLCNNNLLLVLDVNQTTNRDYQVHAGGEYCLFKMLTLRAGINPTEIDCGLGFKFKDYSIDYAFALNDAVQGNNNLGSSNRIGITIKL
jgi:hypothetical protein